MANDGGYDLTRGSVPRLLLKFAWPLMVTNLLQTLYSLADMVIVGRLLGPDAMSAVTVGGQTAYLLTTFSMGLAAGGQILIAQLKGAGKREEQGQAVGALFTLSIAAGVGVGLAGFLTARPILSLLNTPETAMDSALGYMRITSAGLLFVFCYNAIAGALRGLGDSRRPLLFAAVAAVLNVGLDFLFVGPLSLGAPGTALATVIAQGVAAALGAVTLFLKRREFVFDFKWRSFIPVRSKLLGVLKIGVPFGLQMCLLNLSNLFITGMINPYGVAASAALGAGSRVTNLCTVPMMAIGNGASTSVGQNMGAGQPDRAAASVRWALVYTLSFSALTVAVTLLFSRQLLGVFTQEAEVIEIGVTYLGLMAWSYVGHALHSAFNAAVLGVGFSLYSLLASGVEALVGRVGLTWLFQMFWGLTGIFTAQAIAPYLAAVISGIYCLSGRWKKRRL